MIHKCKVCGKEFHAVEARVNAKLCSNACRYIYQGITRKGENNGRWLGKKREKNCQFCGKPFRFYSLKRKFCSRQCAALGQKRYYGKEHPRSNPESRARGAQSNSKLQMQWSSLVLARDRYTCRRCGITHVQLHAHHILSWKEYPEQRFNTENGIALCIKCHRAVHSKAVKENSVNSVEPLTGKAEGNTEPSANRKISEGVTVRSRA